MAKINNQSVTQKLIDELKLYPGKDVIPTELAEKILAVYQINTQDITVSPKPANVVSHIASSDGSEQTVYAVPATGKFWLTNITLAVTMSATATVKSTTCKVTIDGSEEIILRTLSNLGTDLGSSNHSMVLNLQNPILIDPSTNITVQGATTFTDAACTLVGVYDSTA